MFSKQKGEDEDAEDGGHDGWRSVGLAPRALGPLGSAQPEWAIS